MRLEKVNTLRQAKSSSGSRETAAGLTVDPDLAGMVPAAKKRRVADVLAELEGSSSDSGEEDEEEDVLDWRAKAV